MPQRGRYGLLIQLIINCYSPLGSGIICLVSLSRPLRRPWDTRSLINTSPHLNIIFFASFDPEQCYEEESTIGVQVIVGRSSQRCQEIYKNGQNQRQLVSRCHRYMFVFIVINNAKSSSLVYYDKIDYCQLQKRERICRVTVSAKKLLSVVGAVWSILKNSRLQ